MTLTEDSKKQIIKMTIGIVDDVSNKNYQRRVWIKGEGPECDSFDDAVCDFFPNADGILLKFREFGLTDIQYLTLMRFRNKFYTSPLVFMEPDEFIDTPEWTEITEMAKGVLEAFNYRKGAEFSWNLHPEKPSNLEIQQKILTEFLEIVRRISNIEIRKRISTQSRNSEPKWHAIVDSSREFFSPCEAMLENSEYFGITGAQKQLLTKLYDEFMGFFTKGDLPRTIIEPAEWSRIADAAKEVLNAFHYGKNPAFFLPQGAENLSLSLQLKSYLQRFFRKFNA